MMVNKNIRKQRRQGSVDGEAGETLHSAAEKDGEDYRSRGRAGHSGLRRENHGWQPTNHFEHEEQFISRIPTSKGVPVRTTGLLHDSQGKIVPGKGVQRRGLEHHDNVTTRPAPKNMEHQPALAHVVSKQHQGMTGSTGFNAVVKGLDAFSMGDIRQAEKLIESGRMGLDEYARKVATGEINRDTVNEIQGPGSFFADEDDGSVAARPWLGSSLIVNRAAPQGNVGQGRIVPGVSAQRPFLTPSPPPTCPAPRTVSEIEGSRLNPVPVQNTGKESNASGLALLQMLVDRKSSPTQGKSSPPNANPPRQLTQQQITELIAMSKRAGPKAGMSHAISQANHSSNTAVKPVPKVSGPDTRQQIIPGSQSRVMDKQSSITPPTPKPAPPHVALLLEQLHRQQAAQHQSVGQPSAASAQPAECQQQ